MQKTLECLAQKIEKIACQSPDAVTDPVGNRWDFYRRYQTYNIIYALARLYLGRNALDASSDPREVFDWNKCVSDLNTVESVINPTNMELYIACKFICKDL